MTWLRAARAIGGLLSIITLLVLLVADFFTRHDVDPNTMVLLLLLISGLLAVDALGERLPITIRFGNGNEGNE